MARDTWMAIERRTWIALAETVALVGLILFFRDTLVLLALGLPLVAHLAWTAVTSVPVGQIPGPPPGIGERRRNHLLRYQVVAFLDQVQRVETFAEKANTAGKPRPDLERELSVAGRRLQAIASDIVKVAGRTGV